MKEKIIEVFKRYHIDLNNTQAEQFLEYYQFLISENKKYNLTAITEFDEVLVKHFVDSILPCNLIPKGASVADIGTGAGFPGVPLKIIRPDIKLTLIDSLQKRINFLSQLLDILDINNVKLYHSRAEDIGDKREKYDVALSRAVAKVPTLCEYLLPYVKVGGMAFMYKASGAKEELDSGKKAIETLGGKTQDILSFRLNEVESERNIIVIKKIKLTPLKYPRGKNLPKTSPIL